MNKLSLKRNFAFLTILLIGLIYGLFLFVAYQKIHSGFLMQFVFLIDVIKNHHQQLIALIFSWSFFINLSAGFVLLVLFFKIIKTFKNSIATYNKTKFFVSNLKIKSENGFYIFHSSKALAFTSGFIFPKIYISDSLVGSVNQTEFQAILLHEQKHQSNHDPLKDFIVNFIYGSLLEFPKKNWVFANYVALVESSCDEHAQSVLNTKTPLISALFKIQKSTSYYPYCFNQFSSQSERIKILTDQKKPLFNGLFGFYSLILLTLLSGSVYLYNSNVFYQCNHLVKCIEIILTPKTNSTAHPQEVSSLATHCQNN